VIDLDCIWEGIFPETNFCLIVLLEDQGDKSLDKLDDSELDFEVQNP